MLHARLLTSMLALAVVTSVPSRVWAIQLGQVDDFEDGSTMAWAEGANSPNPPTNVGTGGPSGAGDNYLADESSGNPSVAGGKMALFNRVQWAGDYVAAGVNAVTLSLANFGAMPLAMRLALNADGDQWGSSEAFELPSDGIWYEHTFRLTAAHMSSLGASGTIEDALTHVGELRLVSASLGPAWQGDAIAGSLGVDDVTAVAVSVPVEAASWSAVKARFE